MKRPACYGLAITLYLLHSGYIAVLMALFVGLLLNYPLIKKMSHSFLVKSRTDFNYVGNFKPRLNTIFME